MVTGTSYHGRKVPSTAGVQKNFHVSGLTKYPYRVYNANKNTGEGYQGGEKMTEEKQTERKEHCCCCELTGGKTKVRTDKEYRDLMNRLKRIEGQVRGIQNMLEKNAYCTDILTQVAAVNAALNSFNKVLLADHIRTCVADNIREGNDEVIDELVMTLQKLMK